GSVERDELSANPPRTEAGPAAISASGARSCAEGARATAQCFCPCLSLHRRESFSRGVGDASKGVALSRRNRARLPNAAPDARGFLAEVLEALRSGEAPRCREDRALAQIVAADV